jgi:NAD(P)-dependent dehydrogenase (short-subunit alcohol dehydrogenase family)
VRVAVVTGANRGLGAEIARELEARGLRVVKTSRVPQQGFATLDVTRADHVASLAAQVAADGGCDVLVNNAGASLDGFDADVARRTLDVNFSGPLRVTDALLPSMRAGARVVMVSSGMGRLSVVHGQAHARLADPALTRPQLVELMESFVRDIASGDFARRGWPSSAYSVSKVGLNALVRVLARELEGDARRILVNSVNPGWVRTRMGGRSAPRSVEEGARTPVFLAMLPDGSPTGAVFSDEKPVPF